MSHIVEVEFHSQGWQVVQSRGNTIREKGRLKANELTEL